MALGRRENPADDGGNNPAEDAAPLPEQWVQLAVMGRDITTLDFTPGMTVGEVIAGTGQQVGRGTVVTVNGRPAGADQVLEPNSVVQITSRVSNGQ